MIRQQLVTLVGPILSHMIRALKWNNVYVVVLSFYSHEGLLSGPVFQLNTLFVSDFTKDLVLLKNSKQFCPKTGKKYLKLLWLGEFFKLL